MKAPFWILGRLPQALSSGYADREKGSFPFCCQLAAEPVELHAPWPLTLGQSTERCTAVPLVAARGVRLDRLLHDQRLHLPSRGRQVLITRLPGPPGQPLEAKRLPLLRDSPGREDHLDDRKIEKFLTQAAPAGHQAFKDILKGTPGPSHQCLRPFPSKDLLVVGKEGGLLPHPILLGPHRCMGLLLMGLGCQTARSLLRLLCGLHQRQPLQLLLLRLHRLCAGLHLHQERRWGLCLRRSAPHWCHRYKLPIKKEPNRTHASTPRPPRP